MSSVRMAGLVAMTAAAYATLGLLALPLAEAPGYSAPLYPAAGLALASVLAFGWPMLAAVALGACCVNAVQGLTSGVSGDVAVWLPVSVAAGATLQAAAGAAMVRRVAGQPLTLTTPREVVAFFCAGTASCLISAGAATTALTFAGLVAPSGALRHAFTWWIGDLLGVLIAAPVVLTVIGVPREAWRPRRLGVGLTLTVAMVLLALGIRQLAHWTDDRRIAGFEHDAANAAFAIGAELREPLRALEAMRGVFLASNEVTRTEMQLASRAWLDSGNLHAIGWMEPVLPDAVATFEAEQRAEGLSEFRVFDRAARPAGPAPAAPDETKMVIRFIDPVLGNDAALGVNAMSVSSARPAIENAIATGRPSASSVFPLSSLGHTTMPGVVVYQAIYRGPIGRVDERRSSLAGLVFVSLEPEAQLARARRQFEPYLSACLLDSDPRAARRAIAGGAACQTASPALLQVQEVDFAGRSWELRITADRAGVPGARIDDASVFALIGLFATALLGGFLLISTGRANRIETAVRERTAALQSEVREREVAEAALRESEQRFRSILDNVPIGMVYSDLAGNVVQTNASMCELTGYSQAELLRLHPADYTHPDDVPQDAELMRQLVRGELPRYRRHARFRSKAGATVWVQATVSLLRDAEGGPHRVIAVVEDITEHLRLEEAEHAREVAESSNRAKSEFLSRMSHELRTPLNAMLGFAQLLDLDQRHPLADSQRPWVAQIQQAGWHLLEMINDVLDLSRIESGNLRLQTEALNLADVLAASLSMVEADAQRRRVEISLDLGAGATAVLGDATRVKQILTNLLSNAVKYNADAGRIHVSSRSVEHEMVEITVADTGLGMTPEQLAHLFQPFNRLGRERSMQEGTGIGLVISQRLAGLLGGSLHVRSNPGEGSSFTLSLPGVADADTVRSDLIALQSTPAEYHRRVVHYVEDNETNVEVMRGILAQRPQVQMEISITGLDSLAAMRVRRPDLVLLDMHLPDISGLELLRHIKADLRTSDIPVVVVSADAMTQQMEAAFEAGAAHYLTKPVSVAELLAVVDGLLERIDTRYG